MYMRDVRIRDGSWIARRASMPRILLAAAFANCVVVFVLLAAFGSVGSGIGQGFYLSIALVALATGPELGALAGFCALVLYVCGLAAGERLPREESFRCRSRCGW